MQPIPTNKITAIEYNSGKLEIQYKHNVIAEDIKRKVETIIDDYSFRNIKSMNTKWLEATIRQILDFNK